MHKTDLIGAVLTMGALNTLADVAGEDVDGLHTERYPKGCPRLCEACWKRLVTVYDTRYSSRTGGVVIWYHAGAKRYAVTRGIGEDARKPSIDEFSRTNKRDALERARHLLGWAAVPRRAAR